MRPHPQSRISRQRPTPLPTVPSVSRSRGNLACALVRAAPRTALRPNPLTSPRSNQSLAKPNRKPPQTTENKHQRPKSIASFCRDSCDQPSLRPRAKLAGSESRSPASAITTHYLRITTHQPPITHFLIAVRRLEKSATHRKQTMAPDSNQLFFELLAREQYCFGPQAFAAIIVPLASREPSSSTHRGLRKP
jgi:hypothetical protein